MTNSEHAPERAHLTKLIFHKGRKATITKPLGCQLPGKTNKPRSCTVTSQSVSNLFALSSRLRPWDDQSLLGPWLDKFPGTHRAVMPSHYHLFRSLQFQLEQRAKTDPKIDQFFAISLLFVVIGRSAGMFRGLVCTSGNYYVLRQSWVAQIQPPLTVHADGSWRPVWGIDDIRRRVSFFADSIFMVMIIDAAEFSPDQMDRREFGHKRRSMAHRQMDLMTIWNICCDLYGGKTFPRFSTGAEKGS